MEEVHSPRPRWKRVARRVAKWALGVAGTAVVGIGFLGCCVFSGPRYVGPVSDHFDGEGFHNDPRRPRQLASFLKWRMNRDAAPWPDGIQGEPGPPPVERVARGEMRVTFVNHATCLVQMDGLNILTDPVWSDRVGPLAWIGPPRHRAAGIRFEDLPPIDLVLVSHNHYDALDVATLRRLAKEHRPRICVGLGNTAYLESEDIAGGEDFDWWDTREVAPEIRVTAVPVRHFSGRGFCDGDGTLWCGFVVDGPAGRLYFAGDTGWGKHFAETRARLGSMRLALLPTGSYRPQWFMAPVHIDPADAVRAHEALGARTSVGIHFGTFPMGDDGPDEPAQELARQLEMAAVPAERFWTLPHGQPRDVP